jgi:predicted AAA+ superfamily ATPase
MKALGALEYLLVIDEIQKIDNWSEIVKQQWDKDTRENVNIKVILLGSSRLLIQKGLTESLAGSVIRQRSSSPKFQVYNNALLTSQNVTGRYRRNAIQGIFED